MSILFIIKVKILMCILWSTQVLPTMFIIELITWLAAVFEHLVQFQLNRRSFFKSILRFVL